MKYGIVRGQAGQQRPVRGAAARAQIERELHGVVLASTSHLPKVPDRRFYELRQWRQKPLGGVLWFIDASHAIGTPMHILLVIPRVLAAYIEDLYSDTPHAAAVKKVA